MDSSELRARMKAQDWPANQEYDPETLRPLGMTKERVALMERNMPQLLEGGESLLDVGSNKGFIPLYLRDRFGRIDGYEPSPESHCLAESTRRLHGADNVEFVNKSFRQIPVNKQSQPYTVVYAGSIHHHLFKDALLHGAPPFLPLKKLMALTDKYLILDGPFEFGTDCSLNTWADQYGWGQEIRVGYTFEAHVDAMKPQFELVHGPFENERGRQSAVFQRVAPDIPHREITEKEVEELKATLPSPSANKLRDPQAVLRDGQRRYKFDVGLQSDGVFLILNSLLDWFPRTEEVLICDGKRIGDMTEWIDGCTIAGPTDLWRHWLKLNDVMACVGLIESHFKPSDYRWHGGRMIDIDVDMIWNTDRLASNRNHIQKWRDARLVDLGEELAEVAKYVASNIRSEFVFQKALEMSPCQSAAQ